MQFSQPPLNMSSVSPRTPTTATKPKITAKASTSARTKVPKVAPPEADRSDRLTVDQIVQTALRLTRERGLKSFTMRTLADELGVSPMATYYHVKNKDVLIELIIEAVTETIVMPDESSGTWSQRLWQLNRSCRKAYAAHPGLVEEVLARLPGEVGRRQIDCTVGLLEEAGFDAKEARLAYLMLEATMFGRSVLERTHRAPISDDKVYRWTFDTLVAGFEARISSN